MSDQLYVIIGIALLIIIVLFLMSPSYEHMSRYSQPIPKPVQTTTVEQYNKLVEQYNKAAKQAEALIKKLDNYSKAREKLEKNTADKVGKLSDCIDTFQKMDDPCKNIDKTIDILKNTQGCPTNDRDTFIKAVRYGCTLGDYNYTKCINTISDNLENKWTDKVPLCEATRKGIVQAAKQKRCPENYNELAFASSLSKCDAQYIQQPPPKCSNSIYNKYKYYDTNGKQGKKRYTKYPSDKMKSAIGSAIKDKKCTGKINNNIYDPYYEWANTENTALTKKCIDAIQNKFKWYRNNKKSLSVGKQYKNAIAGAIKDKSCPGKTSDLVYSPYVRSKNVILNDKCMNTIKNKYEWYAKNKTNLSDIDIYKNAINGAIGDKNCSGNYDAARYNLYRDVSSAKK